MVGPPSVRPAAPAPHLLDRPGTWRGRQVVEQHPVGQLAGQGQHARVEGAQHDLGPALAQPHPEAEAARPRSSRRRRTPSRPTGTAAAASGTRAPGPAGARRRGRRATRWHHRRRDARRPARCRGRGAGPGGWRRTWPPAAGCAAAGPARRCPGRARGRPRRPRPAPRRPRVRRSRPSRTSRSPAPRPARARVQGGVEAQGHEAGVGHAQVDVGPARSVMAATLPGRRTAESRPSPVSRSRCGPARSRPAAAGRAHPATWATRSAPLSP